MKRYVCIYDGIGGFVYDNLLKDNLTKENVVVFLNDQLDIIFKMSVEIKTIKSDHTAEVARLKEQYSEMVDITDLLTDELIRIKCLTTDDEIKGICDRSIVKTKQHVHVIEQRDKLELDVARLTAERDAALAKLSEHTEKIEQELLEQAREEEHTIKRKNENRIKSW